MLSLESSSVQLNDLWVDVSIAVMVVKHPGGGNLDHDAVKGEEYLMKWYRPGECMHRQFSPASVIVSTVFVRKFHEGENRFQDEGYNLSQGHVVNGSKD
jgi:hypothetical protein